jgi:prepilin-type N-terminal cleavage/methylation domain-containing protein
MLRSDAERGFSLLELIMVIVMIALVLAVTYPSLSKGNATLHLRTAGREVINTMRYAREKAITEQAEMRIVADRENQNLAMTDGYGDGARYYALPHDVKIGRIALRGQEIMEGPLVIRFLPNGSAEPAELLLASDRGGVLRIVTDPVTGSARVAPTGER